MTRYYDSGCRAGDRRRDGCGVEAAASVDAGTATPHVAGLRRAPRPSPTPARPRGHRAASARHWSITFLANFNCKFLIFVTTSISHGELLLQIIRQISLKNIIWSAFTNCTYMNVSSHVLCGPDPLNGYIIRTRFDSWTYEWVGRPRRRKRKYTSQLPDGFNLLLAIS